MTYVDTWDETKPAGSRDANLGDDDIREFKRALTERLRAGGMYFPTTNDSDAGLFNYIKFIEQSSNPTSEANRGHLFTKDVSGVTELYWMDSSGTVTQLTSGGKVLLTTLGGYAARGDMIRGGASGWEKAPLGASGKFWKSDGTDAYWGDANFQTAASQAEVEAAVINTAPVTPGRLNYHPGAAKAWCMFNGTTVGTNAPTAGHNVTSVTRNGAGDYTINFTTAFSSANYALLVTGRGGAYGVGIGYINATGGLAAGSARIGLADHNGAAVDPDIVCVVAYGDQ